MAQNLEFFSVMFLSYSDTYKQKKEKKKKVFVFLVPISHFWKDPGQQPGWPENIPCYLSLEVQQTEAGSVLGADLESPHPTRHWTADTRWEGRPLALLLLWSSWKGVSERKKVLDRIKNSHRNGWSHLSTHTHPDSQIYIINWKILCGTKVSSAWDDHSWAS